MELKDEETQAFVATNELILEKVQVMALVHLGATTVEAMDVRSAYDLSGELLYSIRTFILAEEMYRVDRTVSYPADWWQAFKQRWFPARMKRRWPVKMHDEHIVLRRVATYPYANRVIDWLGNPVVRVLYTGT